MRLAYSGKKYRGAACDMKVMKRVEAEERNVAYQIRIAESSEEDVA